MLSKIEESGIKILEGVTEIIRKHPLSKEEKKLLHFKAFDLIFRSQAIIDSKKT